MQNHNRLVSLVSQIWWHTVATEICNTKRTSSTETHYFHYGTHFPLWKRTFHYRNALSTTERTFHYTKRTFLYGNPVWVYGYTRRQHSGVSVFVDEKVSFCTGKCVSVEESAFPYRKVRSVVESAFRSGNSAFL